MSVKFSWSRDGLNKPLFVSLTNILSLRNGGQLEAQDAFSDDATDATGETSSSMPTTHPATLAGSELKPRFLDRLAEVVSCKKGPTHVACAVMKEENNQVTIWVARNEGFVEKRYRILQKVEHLRRKLIIGEDEYAEELWKLMLEYYSPRLCDTYIPNVRHRLNACRTQIPDSLKDQFDELDKLMKKGKNHELVLKAYRIRRNSSVQKFRSLNAGTRRLWISIGFLGRLRSAYNVFIEIARSFNNVAIIRVPKPMQQKPIRHPLSLTETMQYLRCTLDTDTIQNYVQRNATTAKIKKQFQALQHAKLFVHAEVQIILALGELVDIFQYIGCSKRSCYMCWNFLRAFGAPQTKGSHGKLYRGWIIPELKLGTRILEKLVVSIKELQRAIEEEIRSPIPEAGDQIAESSIGLSAIGRVTNSLTSSAIQLFLQENEDANARQWWADFIREKMQETNPGDRNTDEELSDEITTIPIKIFGECYICDSKTSRHCSICQRDWFCREFCQSKMGIRHKFMCAIRRPLNSADYLYLALLEDVWPDDPQALDDFGFRDLHSGTDRSMLLGIFRGLELLEIPNQEVYKWQSEHTLEENIIKIFSQLPESSRGGYFPWFLQNRHRLTFCQSFVRAESMELQNVRLHLDLEDRGKSVNELKPEAKQKCFKFYIQVTNMYHPQSNDQLYYDFGFCVCSNEYEEMKLGGLYQTLIVGDKFSRFWYNELGETNTCGFAEFWKAFEGHKLIELIDAKGLKELRKASAPPHFETFMSGGSTLSIWDLKWFLANESWVDPEKCVVVDYGFSNCKTFHEKLDLKMAYKTLVAKADPLELHQVCIRGQIFEFAKGHMELEISFKQLMKNIYQKRVANPMANESAG